MMITGITVEQFELAVQRAGGLYGGNIRAEIGREYSHTRFAARILPITTGYRMFGRGSDLAPGQRRSWQERRINAVCWHVYRDVLIEVFAINPNAKVRTAMAKYLGIDGFNREYPNTAFTNVGSMMQPVNMIDLCDCYGPNVIPAPEPVASVQLWSNDSDREWFNAMTERVKARHA